MKEKYIRYLVFSWQFPPTLHLKLQQSTGSSKSSSTNCSQSKVRAISPSMVKLYTIRVISRSSGQTIITLVKNRWITEAEWLAHFTATGAYQECQFQCAIRIT